MPAILGTWSGWQMEPDHLDRAARLTEPVGPAHLSNTPEVRFCAQCEEWASVECFRNTYGKPVGVCVECQEHNRATREARREATRAARIAAGQPVSKDPHGGRFSPKGPPAEGWSVETWRAQLPPGSAALTRPWPRPKTSVNHLPQP